MPTFKLVRADARIGAAVRSLLLVSLQGERKEIQVEERAIKEPIVDLALHEFYVLSDLIDAGEPYGVCMAALVPYIWKGQRHYLRAAALNLMSGALLAVPFGFFDRLN